MDELLLTDEERKTIPKGFHYLLDYKEELDWLLEAQHAKDKKHYATKIEEAKVRGLEAGKILERKRIILELEEDGLLAHEVQSYSALGKECHECCGACKLLQTLKGEK